MSTLHRSETEHDNQRDDKKCKQMTRQIDWLSIGGRKRTGPRLTILWVMGSFICTQSAYVHDNGNFKQYSQFISSTSNQQQSANTTTR